MKRKVQISICLLLMVAVLSACGSKEEIPDKLNWDVQDFTYKDQNGDSYGLSDLKGKVWLANFIFTNCTTVCPPMTANMAKLQKQLKEADVPVQIVSFSVNPKRDTPKTLKKFGNKHNANFPNWHFMTGYDFKVIKSFAKSSFKTGIAKPAEGSDQFTHGTSFYLVNKNGKIVKRYNGYQDVPYDQIVKHAKILSKKGE